MLPVHLALNIRQQALYYLQSTFNFREPAVERAFERFLLDPENGLFKGPWVQLRRPFRPAAIEETAPFEFPLPFHPFKHQNRSWRRLSSRDQTPRPTIVTTGTGSGKTECFLFPILDHCLRMKLTGQPGIKAIILYPMNALAADQEKRFAQVIWRQPQLRQAGIRVGNYTGRYDPAEPGAGANSGATIMGEDHGITNHAAQQDSPPDILLTNYKMLDYLLLRPQDQRLWRFNEPGVLRYLVLDELHTYDGAQGADVACLIRRLKERLTIPRGQLCVVGTSATLDDREPPRDSATGQTDGSLDARESSAERLARFAGTLFEEDIPTEAVIGEDRLTVEEIIAPNPQDVTLPNPRDCRPLDDEDALKYALRQSRLWGGPVYEGPEIPLRPLTESDRPPTAEEQAILEAVEAWSVELGAWLKHRLLFKYLLEIFDRAEVAGEPPLTWPHLVQRLAREELGFTEYPRGEDREMICASFFALVAQAKEIRSQRAFPLAPTQVQIWIRELRRLGRLVSEKPVFNWLDEPTQDATSLPTFHCGECGECGWVALKDVSSETLIQARGVQGFSLHADPTQIYRNWFGFHGSRSPGIVVISPVREEPRDEPEPEEILWERQRAFFDDEPRLKLPPRPRQTDMGFQQWYLCPKSLALMLDDVPCPLTGDTRRIRVRVSLDVRTDERGVTFGDQGCPHCGSKEGVFFIGSQSATLSSVAIDELFGSVLNSDPKLLAFTDSVQDASHRAGFFTARTYHFTLRTALQHVIDDAGPEGIPLHEAGARLLDWWSRPRPGWPGQIREALASLLPPDLHEYAEFLNYRNNPAANSPPVALRQELETRLTWEVASEFGLMLTHGRTMEAAGSSCIGWDEQRVHNTLTRLLDRLPGIDDSLAKIPLERFKLWLYGILHRARSRGAVDHFYLQSYARQNFWGKYPFNQVIEGRETFPPGGHYKPHLMVTQAQTGHDHLLAPTRGSQPPWHLVWARRALRAPNVDETSLLDLLDAVLTVGTESGLFVRLHPDVVRLHPDVVKRYYALSAQAAALRADCVPLRCSQTGRTLVRPQAEAELWLNAPSLEYAADKGVYQLAEYTSRQRYYQDRYRKGALRRVVASEHTGLLATEERERLEQDFSRTRHTDDPNVLTCTSTLEMGIDIGDLSSTMLCSIPPNTSSYLQRIGRAGRATGTALIVSVVNQRPHDLFFYGRPVEMLRGKVDPPGCWLDASAVLVRQYLAFAIDSATHAGELQQLPRSGRQLVEDLARPDGHINRMMQWVTLNEAELRSRFLRRFQAEVREDTRQRFIGETTAESLRQRLNQATGEFQRMVRDLENARTRLKDQLSKLDEEEKEAQQEIERELRILQGRLQSLSRTTALEILTDAGLLPNYAFPERGVRFYGAVYNKHRKTDDEHNPIEVTRAAGVALRELAPSNHFYTHSRRFDIQQIAIGNKNQPLIEEWAICGACGHMRPLEDLKRPEATPACPQCGHDRDANSQLDQGQHRAFIEFARSQALSYMEHYESLSADSSEERNREYYQMIKSFDLTQDTPVGAVGDESLPFGIEYRASVIMREINVGYQGEQGLVPFGVDQLAPDNGFQVCGDCGVAINASKTTGEVDHRRSCSQRRKNEKRRQEGRSEMAYNWSNLYLYRELKSEAIRLLLPVADNEDIDTLTACIHLGLRLRFEGNPAHLIVSPQVMPDSGSGMNRYYLMLLDAVPGGTGYLKTLYQEKDAEDRDGEGILEVLRLARTALETCVCRQMHQDPDRPETDGCYRCIRSYHLQYQADRISRERGITLLKTLIEAGEKRLPQQALAAIKPNSLFGSMLEKKFVDTLREWVEAQQGAWEQTIIRGNQGFRFSIPQTECLWELELQPLLGLAQGVSVGSQPDFLLRADDSAIKPVAIFTDGFQYHCHPHNRLADDLLKRRAILESGNYHVWNVTWEDLNAGQADQDMVCLPPVLSALQTLAQAARRQGERVPEVKAVGRNGLEQLKTFIRTPHRAGWSQLASFAAFCPLQARVTARKVAEPDLRSALNVWQSGPLLPPMTALEGGEWVHNDRASLTQDLVAYITAEDAVSNRRGQALVLARLGDTEAEVTQGDFLLRWRRFLACLNLYQFLDNFRFWATSEVAAGTAPEIPLAGTQTVDTVWQEILESVLPSLRPYVQELAASNLPVPQGVPEVEFYNEQIDDDAFAELAWPSGTPPVALLAGEQSALAADWQRQNWKVITPDEIQARGIAYLIDHISSSLQGN